jgi:hypothetical protein
MSKKSVVLFIDMFLILHNKEFSFDVKVTHDLSSTMFDAIRKSHIFNTVSLRKSEATLCVPFVM